MTMAISDPMVIGAVAWVCVGMLFGLIVQELRVAGVRRSLEASKQAAIQSVVSGASERMAEETQQQEKIQQAREELAERERAAWEREREAISAVNQQYFSMVQELQAKLMAAYDRGGQKPGPGAVAMPREAMKLKVDAILGEATGHEDQVLRLVDAGFTQRQAELFLRDELPDSEIPDFDQRLDTIIAEGVKEGLGIAT